MNTDSEMLAPGAQRRSDAMSAPDAAGVFQGSVFTMTATHLARTMETARTRERTRIASYLDGQADAAEGEGAIELAASLREHAEYVRSLGVATPRLAGKKRSAFVDAADVHVGSDDPLLRDIDAEVAEQEKNGGEALPPVRHGDDFADGLNLVQRRSEADALARRGPR